MADSLYWAYVEFVDKKQKKRRPVLFVRQTEASYIVLRLSSKYKDKPKFIQSKYIEIKDWKKSHLSKPSWIDTYRTYELPKNTELKFIGKLSRADLFRLSKYFKM